MVTKSMTVSEFETLPYYRADDRPANLTLTQAALDILEDDQEDPRPPRSYTLTAAAREALDQERKQACADVLMAELKRYPALQLALAEHFKQAYQAYDDYEAAVGLSNVQQTAIDFSQACEALFFQLKGAFDLATRETSL